MTDRYNNIMQKIDDNSYDDLSSPDEKLVTMDSYAIFAPFKKSALALSSKLFSSIFSNSPFFVGKL